MGPKTPKSLIFLVLNHKLISIAHFTIKYLKNNQQPDNSSVVDSRKLGHLQTIPFSNCKKSVLTTSLYDPRGLYLEKKTPLEGLKALISQLLLQSRFQFEAAHTISPISHNESHWLLFTRQ